MLDKNKKSTDCQQIIKKCVDGRAFKQQKWKNHGHNGHRYCCDYRFDHRGFNCRYQKKDDWEDIYLCSFSADYRTTFWVSPHAHYHIILLKNLKCRNVPLTHCLVCPYNRVGHMAYFDKYFLAKFEILIIYRQS